jgi:hypothetical protein
MVGVLFWTLVIASAAIAAAVVIYALVIRRGRSLGTAGIVQRSRLTCPKCRQVFDYDWVPGTSVNTVRLATYRYMRCPLCHRWGFFDIYGTMIQRPPPAA